jgi:hypothetical protein
MFKSKREQSYKLSPQLKFYDSMKASWKTFSMFGHFGNIRSEYCNTDIDGLRFNNFQPGFKSIFDEKISKDCAVIVGNSTAFGEGVSKDNNTISNILSNNTDLFFYNLCGRGFNGFQEIILLTQNLRKIKNLKKIFVITGINDVILPEYEKIEKHQVSPIYGQNFYEKIMSESLISWKFKILKLFINPFLRKSNWHQLNKLNWKEELFKNSTDHSYKVSYNKIIENTIESNIDIWNYLANGIGVEIKIFLQPICLWSNKNITKEENIIINEEKSNNKIKNIFDIADLKKYEMVKRILKKECEKKDIYFEDLNEIIHSKENTNLWLFNGNFHLSDLGTDITAKQILHNY